MAQRLGKYELLSRIAKGGMAETFRARIEGAAGVTKQVVIKKVLPALAEDQDFIAAFINEARLSAGLSHGNIAQVFEFGRVDGDYFIAMEWVDGRSLAQVFKRTAELKIPFLPLSVACFLAIEVLKALHYAHTRTGEDGRPLNLVHRDVSPENILVSFEGQVKVVDFGVAKAVLQGRKETEPGLVKGKFLYFSPEQANALPVDGRSDVFALGSVLYQMLSGAMPFNGQMHVVIHSIQHALFTPVEQVNPLVPARLAEVVSRAMAKELSQRYGSALEMQQALTSLLYREDPTFSSETIKHWMATLFTGQPAVSVEDQLPTDPVAPPVERPPVVAPMEPTPAPGASSGTVLAVGAALLVLGAVTMAALRPEPEAIAKPVARPPALAKPPIPVPKPTAPLPVDAVVYPSTVVVRAQRHRIRFEGLDLPNVTFDPGSRPQVVEREASDEDSPLLMRVTSPNPAHDGSIRLVLQRPVALLDVTSGRLFDFRPFETPGHASTRKLDLGDPATRLTLAADAAVIDARAATWMTVENVPPNEKVKLTLRAIDPQAWAGRPRPASVVVVWKRAFGRLLPAPGGDWPDELDRAVLTADRPLVVEHATALAITFADSLATAEKDSVLVEVFGTGEPASKPDPAAIARAAQAHLQKAPVEKSAQPTSKRRPIPKTIDLNGPSADVFFDEALTLFQAGRFAQARGKLDRCLAMAPNDFECHKLMGAVLDRLGDFKRAVKSYREFLRLAPAGDPDVPKVEALIELHQAQQ